MSLSEISRQFRRQLAPGTLLAGIALGLAGMAVLGRQAAGVNPHRQWVRFTQWISPETKYYPTINEMLAIVRANAKPGQILVIVGGNSVLRGVGQPPDQVWSKRLQEFLGPDYCVINFAFNGSLITDGAAVAAEALRKEFPRQIYLANAAPTQAPTPDGSGTYRFVHYEARAKGLLEDDPGRNAAIAASNLTPALRTGLRELQARSWLDRILYFQDFWNRATYTTVNTVWAPYLRTSPAAWAVTDFLSPRQAYKDPEPDFLTLPMENRYKPSDRETEMLNVRGNSMYAYQEKDAAGRWLPYAPVWDAFTAGIRNIIPPDLKPRTLILLGRTSPYYRRDLTPTELERDDLSYARAIELWQAGGFAAIEFGREFTVSDYGDRTHLTSLGGAKLARLVGDKIRAMSAELGYIKP